MTPRLRSDFIVSAILRQAQAGGAFALVSRRGHEEGGMVHIHLRRADGDWFLSESTRLDGTRGWQTRLSRESEAKVEAALADESRFDADMWVVEIEGEFEPAMLPEGTSNDNR